MENMKKWRRDEEGEWTFIERADSRWLVSTTLAFEVPRASKVPKNQLHSAS